MSVAMTCFERLFSSAFNTKITEILLTKLIVPASTCQWITNFLTDGKQEVKQGRFTSSTRTVSTNTPQGCGLCPLLFSLYTNGCTLGDPSVKLLRYVDGTPVVYLIRDGDESVYR